MQKKPKSGPSGVYGGRPRPTIRQGTDGGSMGPTMSLTLDRRLGPWAYEWPVWFGSFEGVSLGSNGPIDTTTYFGGVPTSADEGLPPLPRQWIGKTLIRTGQKPPEVISTGTITPTQANKYVFEDQIKMPYIILGPKEITSDYITGRLTIYTTDNSTIQNVRYG